MKQQIACRLITLAVVAFTALSPARRSVRAQPPQPPWRTHITPWKTHTGQPRPWRDDPRLPGWPPSTSGSFSATLRDGVRAYRAGRNGHNQPGIDRCIAVLSPAMRDPATHASRDEQFVGHYVLGRCLAEKYETKRALEQFRAAIALDPDDYDSHMALLAELSVMTHRKPAELSAAEESRWESEFLEELALVRRRFSDSDGVARTLEMVFDSSLAMKGDSEAERAKMRRVGFAVFRCKQR